MSLAFTFESKQSHWPKYVPLHPTNEKKYDVIGQTEANWANQIDFKKIGVKKAIFRLSAGGLI